MTDYSDILLDHFNNPRNVGEFEQPDMVGVAGTPGRGNYMVLSFLLNNEQITDCRFLTYGCPPAIAAGSCITEILKGKSLEEAKKITPEQIDELLGGLPLGRKHCAALAIEALHNAINSVNSTI